MAKSTCKNLYKNFVLAFDKTDTLEIFQEVSSLHFRNKGDKGCSCILGKFASQVKILHESHDVSIDDHLEPLKEHHRKIIRTGTLSLPKSKITALTSSSSKALSNQATLSSLGLAKA